MSRALARKLYQELSTLDQAQLAEVLTFIESLKRKPKRPDLEKLVGLIPADDLEMMRLAIEADCEQVSLEPL